MAETHATFCRICEALCGLEVTVEKNQITQIRPNPSHVSTGGYGCVKGLKQSKLYSSPDRLKYPLKRENGSFVRVSWEQALEEIGWKVRGLLETQSPDAIAMYVGTAAGFGVLHPVFAQGFMTGLGSSSMFASASQDCSNKFAVARLMYGFPFLQPFPDVDHTNCLIVVGANPAISKWSFLQVSNPIKRLKDIERRGGRVFFIDPRKTESAKVAGEHIFIRPNTDVFFYLSFLHELFAIGGVDRERAKEHMKGLEEVEALVEAWPAERTAEITRISPEALKALVRVYHEAEGAALYCSTGVNMGTNGSLGFWLQECINALSGNLDRRGGTLVGHGVIDFPKFGKKNGVLVRDNRSRIGNFGSVNDAYPGGILADEILTPGDRQIKALFVTGGNPLLTMANSNRLRQAFEQLELLVALDIQRSETAELAHYVLPCTSPLERPDLPFIFPLMLGLQSRPYLQATRPVVAPEGEQRDEATIYLDLAKACGVSLFGSGIAQNLLMAGKTLHSMGRGKKQPSVPQELLLSTLLRATGQGTFKELLKHTNGRLREDHKEEAFLGQRVLTDDGRLDLAPESLLEAAKGRLEAHFDQEITDKDRFKLITRRAVTTHNSWTHNIEDFVSKNTNFLYMHPDDAAKIPLAEDDLADVSSQTATVRVPVKFLEELMPGTVALPHGWGHQHAKGMQVASRTTGVNVNILAADGPEQLERISGMAHLTGIIVDIKPAAGPLHEASWSGLPQDEWCP